jgi:hypothetical protein
MGSHNFGEQSISASSFKPDVSEALRNRQGCEVAHALKGMSAGEQLDAIRGYQRESKQDPQHYPKIDVNFDKNGYEIKAKPNPETNDSAKPNKSESILNHKMDQNDNTTSLACKNETMKPGEANQQMQMSPSSSAPWDSSITSPSAGAGTDSPSSIGNSQPSLGDMAGSVSDSKGSPGSEPDSDSVGPPPGSDPGQGASNKNP